MFCILKTFSIVVEYLKTTSKKGQFTFIITHTKLCLADILGFHMLAIYISAFAPI